MLRLQKRWKNYYSESTAISRLQHQTKELKNSSDKSHPSAEVSACNITVPFTKCLRNKKCNWCWFKYKWRKPLKTKKAHSSKIIFKVKVWYLQSNFYSDRPQNKTNITLNRSRKLKGSFVVFVGKKNVKLICAVVRKTRFFVNQNVTSVHCV